MPRRRWHGGVARGGERESSAVVVSSTEADKRYAGDVLPSADHRELMQEV
jgi:hypothetical protein